jgi:hypothetical protein
MPVSNGALGAFNVGRDTTLVIMHPVSPTGQVQLPNVTGFHAEQVTANVHSDRLDGTQLDAELPKGWRFTFDADRGSSDADDFFALLEQAWYTGGSISVGTIYQYVTEVNGSVSTYQMDNCSLKFESAGQWQGDQVVKQRITGRAFRRRKV